MAGGVIVLRVHEYPTPRRNAKICSKLASTLMTDPVQPEADSDADASESARLLRNWQDEHDSALLYDALAELEPEAGHRNAYRELAAAERGHADFW